jgi:hypothetical protein
MTPKEKKDQLIHEFKTILMDSDSECGNEILCTVMARQCALLTVKHVLLNMKKYDSNFEITNNFDYWFEIYNLLRN